MTFFGYNFGQSNSIYYARVISITDERKQPRNHQSWCFENCQLHFLCCVGCLYLFHLRLYLDTAVCSVQKSKYYTLKIIYLELAWLFYYKIRFIIAYSKYYCDIIVNAISSYSKYYTSKIIYLELAWLLPYKIRLILAYIGFYLRWLCSR